MNQLFIDWGIARFKPFLTAVMLPPVPFLALAGIALFLYARRRRRLGCAVLFTGLSLIWLSCCVGAANALAPTLLQMPTALTRERIAELQRHAREPVAIIVLGAGVEEWAPEYQQSSLRYGSLERLRYGLWLGRKTGWPTGFSGGVGWGQLGGNSSAAEATVAQRIATEEFGQPLRWVEAESRDTRENAANTVRLLDAQGVRHVLLVTTAWHMPRALRNFQRAAGASSMTIEAAPMGMAAETEFPLLRWIPSGEGLTQTRYVVREWLGMISGA